MIKITCAACGGSFSVINNKHLASHGLTAAEYRERYPGAPLMTQEHAAKLSARSVAANADRVGVPRTESEKAKMREGQARYRAANPSVSKGPMSEAQKTLLSELAKQRYANGFVHPNLGKHHSDEVKQKISETLSGRTVGPEVAYRAIETKRQRGDDLAFFRGKKHTDATKARISAKVRANTSQNRLTIRAVMLERMQQAGLTLLNDISADVFQLRCNTCGYEFTRTPQQFQPSKFHLKVCDQCHPISPVSEQENALAAFVGQLTNARIIHSDMEVLAPLELDIYLPEKKLAIEYCGLYWHSSKPRYYHRHKLDRCRAKGIRLLTIFEDEWINSRPVVESVLRNALGVSTRAIDARSCTVEPIEATEAGDFLKANHLQGRGRSCVKLGLRSGDELVAMMTFMRGEIAHRATGWEINRFCSKLDCSVRGAASKLFTAFVRQYQPIEVVSYADLRWSDGRVYDHLGFTHVGDSVPNYWYFRPPEMRRMHRFGLRKKPTDPVEVSEKELRQREGWRILWDCGHAKWVYTAKSEPLATAN
jgi:hypothetical protein